MHRFVHTCRYTEQWIEYAYVHTHTHTHQLLFTIDQPAKNPRDSDAISRVIYTNSAIFFKNLNVFKLTQEAND